MLRRFAIVLIVVAVIGVVVGFAWTQLGEENDEGTRPTGRRTFASNDPMNARV